tara:strand:- start:4284 stop:5099 length:816 start_codon:yes stop_codon:yes gene_type:complete
MIAKKIIKSLLDPFTLPHKINFHSRKLFNKWYYQSRYNKNEFEKYQENLFKDYGIDYFGALSNLNDKRSNYLELELKKNLAHSEHQTFFSGLSLINNNINRILEIGTFNAQNAFLLSVLFKKAQVITVDLPSDSNDFINSYKRADPNNLENFLNERNSRISKRDNLSIIEKNSVNLINFEGKFDLIWIDGAHFDPIVTMDIINSLNLLSDKGLILCDDIRKSEKNATWRLINILKKENIIDFSLILKWLDPEHNANPNFRSYISVIKKIKD